MTTIIVLSFSVGVLLYGTQAWLSYTKWIKETSWYFLCGALASAAIACVWFYLIKNVPHERIYGLAMFWDLMAAVVFFFLPLILFDVKLNTVGLIGLILMTIGATLINIMHLWGPK